MSFRLFDRAKFAIERWLVRGTWHRVALVALLILSISLLGGILVIVFGHGFGDLREATWWSFLRLSDPGYLGDDEGIARRSISTVVTVLGYVLFLGLLIAILTQWLNELLSGLEAGVTPVAVSDHVIVLGDLGDTGESLGAMLTALGGLEVPVIVVAGGREDSATLDEAF